MKTLLFIILPFYMSGQMGFTDPVFYDLYFEEEKTQTMNNQKILDTLSQKEKPILLANWAMSPDGTIIPSMNRHDYRSHDTPDGVHTMVDGGTDYIRRGGKYTEMSVYSDDPYEVIRRFVCRGGRGKDGKQPLTYVPLCKMSDEWLKACIEYVNPRNLYRKYYQMELDYRKQHNITIDEN